MITPIIINRLQWKAYLIFMATNLVFVPIIYFLYPETSNLSLEEVDFIFSDGRNPILVAKEMQKEVAMGGLSARRDMCPNASAHEDKEALSERVENQT